MIGAFVLNSGDKVLDKIKFIVISIKNIYLKFSKTHKIREIMKMISYYEMQNIQLQIQRPIPQYSFYTNLLEFLIQAKFKLGAEITEILQELKEKLLVELKNQTKLESIHRSSFIQFFIISVFSFIVILMTIHILDIKIEVRPLFLSLLWQGVGIFVYYTLVRSMDKKILNQSLQFKASFYSFLSLRPLPLSIQDKLEMCSLKNLYTHKDLLTEKFLEVIHQYVKVGQCNEHELKIISRELNMIQEEKLDQLNKKVQALRFFVLCVFFFTSYLFNILQLFGQIGVAEI